MRNRGFTLIELMVVMLIIGITISLASIAFQDNRAEELQREARRLAALIELAADESVVKSSIVGIRFEDHGYAFYLPDGSSWKEIEDDPILRRRELAEPMEIQLLVDGLDSEKPATESGLSGGDTAKAPQPQVYLLPSGEALPFEVSLTHPDLERYYNIRVELTGKLTFNAED